MAESPISSFYEEATYFMSIAFSRLFHEYLLFTVAVVLAVIPFLLFMFRRINGKVYLFKDSACWKGHWLLILCILLSAAKNLWNILERPSDYTETGVEKKIEIIVGVVLAFFALYVVVRLFLFKLSGVIGAIIYIWAFAGFKNFRGIALGFLQMPSVLEKSGTKFREFSLPEQVGCYTIADYYITLAMTVSFLALIITLLLGMYYYRRRYIFCPSRLVRFVKCGYCGKPPMKGDVYCGNCGAELQVAPDVDPVLKALDKDCYCKKCGKCLIGGRCLICDKQAKRRVLRDKIPFFVSMLLVFMAYWFVIYGPEKLSLIYILPADMPKQSQSYSDTYNELTHNLALVEDANWRNRFYKDCELLYLYNTRWAYRKVRSLRSNDWKFYVEFGKASFEQMTVLERTKCKVDALVEEFAEEDVVSEERKKEILAELDSLTVQFNSTVSAQEEAQAEYVLHPVSYSPIEILEYELYDGFRFYLQYIDTRIIAKLLLVMMFLAAACVLNRFSRGTPAMVLEKKYLRFQKNNETRIVDIVPSYVEIEERQSIVNRAGFIFLELICHIVRFVSELWMLLLTLVTGVGIFLSLFRPKNVRQVKNWLIERLKIPKTVFTENTYDQYKKGKRRWRMKMLLWFCICFGVVCVWNNTHESKVDETDVFMELSYCVYWENAPKIVAHLVQINNNGGMDENVKRELFFLIEDGLDNIRELEEVKNSAEYTVVKEKYPEYCNGVFSLCSLDKSYLEEFKGNIEEGLIPDRVMIEQYVKLRDEDFKWLNEKYQEYVEDKTNKKLEEIAGDFVD